ncbi:hypothetical protein [Mesorhizobium helmanticense]|uniref:Uncharacterized protein n=1 Tax=Mesorhizobium helmanticense TaxID=1776423 RepID=A0A2T4J0Y2_9HYPH|nr:hypothetical protein [Mesorhizobium helmanticense]PTE11542.1 hypothetical protein C9427_04790 [Mesorhizobium helmanticense]
MSNEIVVSENPGAAGAGSATGEGLAGGGGQTGFASLTADPARKAEIERILKTDFARYEGEGLDKEYLALLEAEQEAINPDSVNPTRPLNPEKSRIGMCGSEAGRKLVSDWESMGGFKTHLTNVQRDVGAMVRAIGGNREQRVFMEHFDREVPIPARLAVYDEIASGTGIYVTPAPASEVKHFASTPAGKTLVDEWGPSAPEKVAMLRARAKRLTDNMSEEDADDFWAWFEGLDPDPVAAIFRKLAG